MEKIRKDKAVLAHLDLMTDELLQALTIEDSKERKNSVKGILHYWMGKLYEEGVAEAADLKIANDGLVEINKRLKKQLQRALKRISDDR